LNEELLKKLEEEATLAECSIDGRVEIWVNKTEKVNYTELYKIVAQMNKSRQQRLSVST
jgi:hypothetical protein